MQRGIGLRPARPLALLAAVALAVALALQLPAAALLAAPAIAASTGTSTTPVVPAVPDTTSPFSPGVPLSGNTGTPTATTPATALQTTTSSSSSGGISGTGALFIAAGAIVVLGGIAYFIWADSRRHAPAGTAPSRESATQRAGSKTPQKSRKLSPAERRRRKRGKAR
jgi:hypothetical protein